MNLISQLNPQTVAAPEWVTPLFVITMLAAIAVSRENRQAAEGASWVARILAAGACVLALMLAVAGPMRIVLAEKGAVQFALLIDPLSVTMLLLVGFLGVVVTRYSKNYLDGDPGQGRFSRWLVSVLACVMLLVASSNLLIFTLAWIGTSLSLHQLLTFYRDRPRALAAARKKFIVSRLADCCMVTVLVLTWSSHGTWDFNELLQHPEGKHSGWLAALLVAAAMLKSAQFPFHSWLPDTLETPTPVSALMHAGVVNAGGFLIVRLSPLVAESQAALNTLALIGAFTAVFASVIMMTQSSIKKSLAWSTVAQMGFMMLQCGLGAFALAVMHLVAHSLYKAYAFLSSGSIVDISRSSWQPVGRPAAHPLVVLGSLVTAAAIGFGMAKVYGLHLNDNHGQALLLAVFVIAIAYLLWTLWGSSMRRRLIVSGLFIATVATASCLTLHTAFERFLGSSVAAYEPVRSPIEYVTMGIVALIFLAVLILQSQLPAWAAHPAFARLYVHAANGFYFGSFFRKSPSHLHP